MTAHISRLGGFNRVDYERGVLILVWEAREYLSDAERSEKPAPCIEARRLLDAAVVLLAFTTTRHQRASDLLQRAASAATAAAENGALAASYALTVAAPAAPDWDKQRTPKALAIFKRAAETARQEAHRALADLCELFPEAIPETE